MSAGIRALFIVVIAACGLLAGGCAGGSTVSVGVGVGGYGYPYPYGGYGGWGGWGPYPYGGGGVVITGRPF